MLDSIKLSFQELLRKIALFLRVLICFSLFYVHEIMFIYAIVYTCLDFFPMILFVTLSCYNLNKDKKIKFIRAFGIKLILDPSRMWFKKWYFKFDNRNTSNMFNCLFSLWYSLLGIIFSSLFINDFDYYKSDFGCESFDLEVEIVCSRIKRFNRFFNCCLVINFAAFVTSLDSIDFTALWKKLWFKPVSQEEEKIDIESKGEDEETKGDERTKEDEETKI